MIRIGMIGAGRHATKMLYPCLHFAGMELAAVCDQDEAKAIRNAHWFGARQVYTDHQRMLETEKLDAVIICTGPTTHAALTIDCLEHHLPVFVEKPPAINQAEVNRVRQRSEELGTPVMVGTMKRYALVYQKMHAIMQQPEFGSISAVQARMSVGWKNGNGFALLLDAGIHLIDLLRFLMGEVTQVSFQKHEDRETSLSYVILFKFASGAAGSLLISDRCSWMSANERVEIVGEGNLLCAENLTRLTHYQADGKTQVWEPGFSIPCNENQLHFIGGYAGEMQAFAAAVENHQSFSPGIADACADYAILKAIEPDEVYSKGPQTHPHWEAEEAWLKIHH